MKILALQLKRIGDLVLTTSALAALRAGRPQAEITLAMHSSTAGLFPAIPGVDAGIVFGAKRGWGPWQQVLTGHFDVVLDFTGTDRSALATFLARSSRAITFDWVRKKRLRALVYGEFVDSNVRERHTTDHYLDLLRPLGIEQEGLPATLRLPEGEARGEYVVLHPGTARPEKFWLAEPWAEVARHLTQTYGVPIVITTGPDPEERKHAEEILRGAAPGSAEVILPKDLCAFAALLAGARLVVSCDTAAVHLAAAFQRPQIALFGPTNPFHWRPRHEAAVVISAARPDEPVTRFEPRMKGAPMDRISTGLVCRAIDTLLRSPSSSFPSPV